MLIESIVREDEKTKRVLMGQSRQSLTMLGDLLNRTNETMISKCDDSVVMAIYQ